MEDNNQSEKNETTLLQAIIAVLCIALAFPLIMLYLKGMDLLSKLLWP